MCCSASSVVLGGVVCVGGDACRAGAVRASNAFFAGIPSFFLAAWLLAWVSSGQLPSRMETKRRPGPDMTGRPETRSRIRTRVDSTFFSQRRLSPAPTEVNDDEHMVGGCREQPGPCGEEPESCMFYLCPDLPSSSALQFTSGRIRTPSQGRCVSILSNANARRGSCVPLYHI